MNIITHGSLQSKQHEDMSVIIKKHYIIRSQYRSLVVCIGAKPNIWPKTNCATISGSNSFGTCWASRGRRGRTDGGRVRRSTLHLNLGVVLFGRERLLLLDVRREI